MMNSVARGLVQFSRNNSVLLRNSNVVTTANYSSQAFAKYVVALSALRTKRLLTQLSDWISGKKPKPVKEQPKDTVILCQFPRAYNTPSLSPFAMKLETWLRAAGVKYENSFGMSRGNKGLIPFIRLNDVQVDDSQRCIEYLTEIFQIDLNSHLTREERAMSHLVIKLCDDSLLWSMATFRFILNPNGMRDNMLPLLAYWIFAYGVGNQTRAARYRFSKQEWFECAKRDLDAIEALIGDKRFLFSNEKPCEADLALFGLSSQFIFNDTYIVHKYLEDNCPGIIRHNEALKSAYWPDWDSQIQRKPVTAIKNGSQKQL